MQPALLMQYNNQNATRLKQEYVYPVLSTGLAPPSGTQHPPSATILSRGQPYLHFGFSTRK